MRVLAITNLYPNPFQPQRATFNRVQLRLLSEMCPVQIIAPVSWTDELRAWRARKPLVPPSRRIVFDGLTIDHPRVYHIPGILRASQGRFYQASVKRTFDTAVREFQPTIVFSPWIYPDGWAAQKLAKRYGLPVVTKAHGSDILLLPANPGRRAGTVASLEGADGIVAVSQDIANKMIGLGASRQKVRVIYDGIDRSLFCPGVRDQAKRQLGLEPAAPALLFVGNLVPVKGIDILLEACGQLVQAGSEFQLNIIGQGPLRSRLAEQARRLGIAERVHWRGSIPHAQLVDWYRAADLFVLPSRSEGVPNVLLEAAACGTPWVSTCVGGIPEIAHLGSSKLVGTEDPAGLAQAIDAMLSSPASPGNLPRSPYETVTELFNFLNEVVDSRRQSARSSQDNSLSKSSGS